MAFTHTEVDFFIKHLFLPLKLPQCDDRDPELEDALLRLVANAATTFVDLIPQDQQPAVRQVATAVSNLIASRDESGAVDADWFLQAMESLTTATPGKYHIPTISPTPAFLTFSFNAGTSIPLHIVAQNAGVIMTKTSSGIQFEAFELSPLNEAVISTEGRLRRSFPGPAVNLPTFIFDNAHFRSTLAATLSKMSFQEGVGMTPTVRKSGNDVGEIRETMHPGLITELLFSFLNPLSMPANAQRIWKNTRDDVLCKDAFLPWRRSPLWMLVRVMAQLKFTCPHMGTADSTMGNRTYKLFILHILATVIDVSLQLEDAVEAEQMHCMVAKLVGRMLKLELDQTNRDPGITFAKQVLKRAKLHLEQRWATICCAISANPNLDDLKNLVFDKDTTLHVPELDAFLKHISRRVPLQDGPGFSPSLCLQHLSARDLPKADPPKAKEYQMFNLFSVEKWVSRYLSNWTLDNLKDPQACASIQILMESYHGQASPLYLHNPEASSIMILTLMELWVACDKCAVAILPMLAEYDPGLPREHMRLLILPMKGHMVRLRKVEQYLEQRIHGSSLTGDPGSIFSNFGKETSFSVRFFDKSAHHQELRQAIETHAAEQAQKKKKELAERKQEYANLMHEADGLTCDRVSRTDARGNVKDAHSRKCRKHSYLSKAKKIVIDTYEWPLPRDLGSLKSVIFELNPPAAFSEWRDSTIFLLQNVLGFEYQKKKEPRAQEPLQKYGGLQTHYKGGSPRISLLSEIMAHENTHRYRDREIATITDTDVCVNNGLRLHYFDTAAGVFTAKIIATDFLLHKCTYNMPKESMALQDFLQRRFDGEDSTPNKVISTQSRCPPHMSLAEYRSLASIPTGHRIQWHNILVQIRCPIIDFKKIEASLVILQSIYQAGPADIDKHHRDSHSVLGDTNFTQDIICAIREAVGRIEQNWESLYALGVLASITCRQLSFISDSALATDALRLLSELRSIVFRWQQSLASKCLQIQGDDIQRKEFFSKLVDAALICCVTFDLEDSELQIVLSDDNQASVLLQCHNLLHDHYRKRAPMFETGLRPLLHRRWQRLAHRAYPLLAKSTLQSQGLCLHRAMEAIWSAYRVAGTRWKLVKGIDYWMTRTLESDSERKLRLHFNLLTGKLLLNGQPISRLPPNYERHSVYREVFGEVVHSVVPSSVPGMRFCAQRPHHGHLVHFGLQGSDLILHASRDNRVLESIPRRLFQDSLPATFVNDFFHWLDVDTGRILFLDRAEPWKEGKNTWTMTKDGAGWKLANQDTRLVAPLSATGQALATIFSPLQPPLQINLTVVPNGRVLEIELPMLQLEFCLSRGSTSVVSRKLRGLEVDYDQSIGTLIGLQTKLVLRSSLTNDRKVLIPFGEVSTRKEHDHVAICINPVPGSPYVYKLDRTLQRLTDVGSLQSKLFLCYLHALSAYSLPDPLTNLTGTEQALCILKGAALKSFPILTMENLALLKNIDSLSPRRYYFPIGEKVMQQVNWKNTLPALSQHPHFHLAVKELLHHHSLARLYYPDEYIEPPSMAEGNLSLFTRDLGRSSRFRISSFGAEDFQVSSDCVYSGRDQAQTSGRAREAQILSAMLYHRNGLLHRRSSCSPDLASHLLSVFNKAGATGRVQGPTHPSASSLTLAYDSRWLEDRHPEHWAELWCWMHKMAREQPLAPDIEKFRVMMWFSTMAFAGNAELDMLHAAAAIFLIPEVQAIQPVARPSFTLLRGDSPNKDALHEIIHRAAIPIDQTPEGKFPILPHESPSAWETRKDSLHRTSLHKAVGQLVVHLSAQFPTITPAPPEGQANDLASRYIDIQEAMIEVISSFTTWVDNRLFNRYIHDIAQSISRQSYTDFEAPALRCELREPPTCLRYRAISAKDFFSCEPKEPLLDLLRLETSELLNKREVISQSHGLKALVQNLEHRSGSKYEQQYAKELRQSANKLNAGMHSTEYVLNMSQEQLQIVLEDYLLKSQQHVTRIFDIILTSFRANLGHRSFAEEFWQTPRISSTFLLQQLSKHGWAVGGG